MASAVWWRGGALRTKLLVVALAAVISISTQAWVGGATIYSGQMAERRARMHEAILANRLPPGVASWAELGGSGTNRRVATIRLAAALQAATGWSLSRTYAALDTAALFLALVLIFVFFRAAAGTGLAFAGLLYVGAVLPLSYFFHYFHPWDRLSLVLWLLALLSLRRRRWVAVGVVLFAGVLIKPDLLIFPLLVLAAELDVRRPARALVLAGVFAAVTFGTAALVRHLVPGDVAHMALGAQVARNLRDLVGLGLTYPPLLAMALPAILAVAGFRRADRFGRAAALFAVVFAAILFVRSNFVEFRAEMPVLVLLGPAALVGLGSRRREWALESASAGTPGTDQDPQAAPRLSPPC